MTKSATENISIVNKTKGKLPRLPFVQLKNAILGKNYELSIAFVSLTESRAINRTYRKKDRPTNVLSFPLTKKSGELILTPKVIEREVKKFELSNRAMTMYLAIHGLLHLKGLEHGSTMEERERRLLARFGFPLPANLKK